MLDMHGAFFGLNSYRPVRRDTLACPIKLNDVLVCLSPLVRQRLQLMGAKLEHVNHVMAFSKDAVDFV